MPNDDPVDQHQCVENFPGMAKHFYDDTDTGGPPDTAGCGCSRGTAGPDDGVETEGRFKDKAKELAARAVKKFTPGPAKACTKAATSLKKTSEAYAKSKTDDQADKFEELDKARKKVDSTCDTLSM